MNMASASQSSGHTRSARPAHCGYYFQIPVNAEVKSIPISSLPSAIQQKIQSLDSCNEITKTPYAIYVSPVTKHVFPVNHKPSTLTGEVVATLSPTKQPSNKHNPSLDGSLSLSGPNNRAMEENRDSVACLVPVKSSKETASTILQLLQTSDEKRNLNLEYVENVRPKYSDSVTLNLRVIDIKVNALYMHKNRMYLLPERIANVIKAETEAQELLNYPEKTIYGSETMNHTSNKMEQGILLHNSWSEMKPPSSNSETSDQQDVLGNVTPDSSPTPPPQLSSSSHGLVGDRPVMVEAEQKEARYDLPEAIHSTTANPPLSPPWHCRLSQNEEIPVQMTQKKRKISSFDDVENVKKKNNLGDSEAIQESIARNLLTSSPVTHTSPSPSLPLESPIYPSCSPSSLLPCKQSSSKVQELNVLLSPTHGWLLPISPIATITGEENDGSLHHEANSSSSSPSLTSSQGHIETFGDWSPTDSNLRSELSSFCEVDETTKDEIKQRLEERVRECNKLVEDLRKSNNNN